MTNFSPSIEFITSFEEVDVAFANMFRGITVRGKPVKVTYATPDVDLTSSVDLPVLAVYRTSPFRDVSRWNNQQEYIDTPEYDDLGKLVRISKRRFPEPWAIMYGVRAIYENQLDGVELTDQIIRLTQRDDYLPIKGYNYLIERDSISPWGTQYKDFGQIEGGRRRFRETYNYRVDIWFEVDTRTPTNTVQSLEIRPLTFVDVNETKNKKGDN